MLLKTRKDEQVIQFVSKEKLSAVCTNEVFLNLSHVWFRFIIVLWDTSSRCIKNFSCKKENQIVTICGVEASKFCCLSSFCRQINFCPHCILHWTTMVIFWVFSPFKINQMLGYYLCDHHSKYMYLFLFLYVHMHAKIWPFVRC